MTLIPAPNCFANCPNAGGIYVNSAVGGCPPTHPNSQRPHCPPPNPPGMVSCDSCQGGYPVVNMFPMQPPGGGPSCPTGWIPSGSGNPCGTTPTPPPPPIPPPLTTNCQTCNGGNWITNEFPNPNGQCPSGWEVVDGSSPCNVLGEPGISNSFVQNISSGYNQFGCSFLYNRLAVQEEKLEQATCQGSTGWEQMLNNRIIYIEGYIAEACTGTATSGPNGTMIQIGPNVNVPGTVGPTNLPTTAGPELPAQPSIPYQPPVPANPATGQQYIPEIPAQTAVSGPNMAFIGRTQSLEDFYDEIV